MRPRYFQFTSFLYGNYNPHCLAVFCVLTLSSGCDSSIESASSTSTDSTTSNSSTSAESAKATSLYTSSLEISAAQIKKGQTATVTLISKNGDGSPISTGGATVQFSASTSSGGSVVTLSSPMDNKDGTYSTTITGVTRGAAVKISAQISGVGTLSQTPSLLVVNTPPVITPASSAVYPLPSSPSSNFQSPVFQGNSTPLATTSDSDGDLVTVSCSYQTLGLNPADPNFAQAGTNCNLLPALVSSGNPSTVILGTLAPTSGSLSWTPTSTQRGTYLFTINATDGTDQARSQASIVTVAENINTTNLISAFDALNATSAGDGLGGSVPSAPFSTNSSAGIWLDLLSSGSNGTLNFGTNTPWVGTGVSSTSAVSPYGLAFHSATSDSLNTGSSLSGDSQIAVKTWIKPGTPSALGTAIVSNASGTGTTNGFKLRQSISPPGRAELVIGEKYYSYRDLILADHPIAYWRLNETSGTTAYDSTGYGNNATYGGTYTLAQPGPVISPVATGNINTSLAVSGTTTTDGYAGIWPVSGTPLYTVTDSSYTFEAWVQVTAWPINASNSTWYGSVLGRSGDNSYIGVSPYGKLCGNIWTATPASISFCTTTTYTLGTWHHLIMSVDDTAKWVNLYVDGLPAISPIAYTGHLLVYGSEPIFVGTNYSGTLSTQFSWPLTGNVSEAAIYGYSLSATQVLSHYNTGISTFYTEYPGNAVLADKPVGYWRLGEKSGSVAYDLSGNGNNGTYVGGYTLNQSGALSGSGDSDSATAFNGASGYVDIPNSTALNTTQFSIETWIKTTSTAVNILSKNTGAYQLYLVSGEVNLYVSGSCSIFLATPAVNDGNWHHIVIAFNGTTGKIYIDGVNGAVSNQTCTMGTNTSDLTIGSQGQSGYFPGTIDEVAFYNYPLSAAQVSNHYNLGYGAGWWLCQSKTQLNSSNWNLLSAIYSGTISQLFVNGQQECSVTPGTTYTGSSSVYAGGVPGTSNFWQGVMSYLGLYGSSSTPVTATNINSDFISTANRYRQVPIENIVNNNNLLFHFDSANAQQGTIPYSNGCPSSEMNAMDFSPTQANLSLFGFSNCSTPVGTLGWYNSGSAAGPFSLDFNGATNSAYAIGPHISGLDGASHISVESWVQWGGAFGGATSPVSIARVQGGSNTASIGQFALTVGDSPHGAQFYINNGSWIANGTTTQPIDDKKWHHVVGTFDGININTFVDGVLGRTSALGSASLLPTNTAPLFVGAYYWNAGVMSQPWNGRISIVRIYSSTLSLQQIKQNCLAQQARFGTGICASP